MKADTIKILCAMNAEMKSGMAMIAEFESVKSKIIRDGMEYDRFHSARSKQPNFSAEEQASYDQKQGAALAQLQRVETRITRLKALVEATTDEFDALLECAVTAESTP